MRVYVASLPDAATMLRQMVDARNAGQERKTRYTPVIGWMPHLQGGSAISFYDEHEMLLGTAKYGEAWDGRNRRNGHVLEITETDEGLLSSYLPAPQGYAADRQQGHGRQAKPGRGLLRQLKFW